ncbi:MAG: LlaJI family restriction endonuclease, partial [Fibrobacterales bacterium]|nr:LlaJI family restriction endonuclease [Fibrobacterales bacterium]
VDWEDEKHTALRPDTIMLSALNDDFAKIFVLDAKYYRHGEDPEGKSGLPATGSILKQIAYAEFIDEKRNRKTVGEQPTFPLGEIYNAFILPYDGKNNSPSSDYAMKCFGHAGCKWKEGKPYHKIYGIFLDVRAIMHRHPHHSDTAIEALAQLIENESAKKTAPAQ